MDNIEKPEDDQCFFDKDHIVFYVDDEENIKCAYSLMSKEIFQDLILSVLGGAITDQVLAYLMEDLDAQGCKEESLSMLAIKHLLRHDDHTPVIKPSNFK
ncbi:MAG: hypothetical protein CL833_05005 [Crocinitomicaceae bacterium]|nr:hypothetical protein [Crocinitomicaceae bacterium]